MIGQTELLYNLKTQIESDVLPKFIILTGPKGSQKQLVAEYIVDMLKSYKVVVDDISVEQIRNIINSAYTVSQPTAYIIPNADKMSISAKNALLKVTEEPPNKTRFIMTLQDINSTLDTIKSRATIYQMQPFTPDELLQYYNINYKEKVENKSFLLIAETPFEIDLLVKYGITEFNLYVDKVINNIASVSGSNAFKIADNINLKDSDEKYDLKLFWKAFERICANKLLLDINYYAPAIQITSECLSKLNITGINKQMLFDKWILDIRSIWM